MDQGQDIYAKAFAELTGIDAEIAALEKRRMALRQFVELGQRLFASHGQPTSDASGDSHETHQVRVPRRRVQLSEDDKVSLANLVDRVGRENSLKARVLNLSKSAIRHNGPMSTRELVTHIEAAGVEVTGADKPTTVSVILSRSDEFKSDRKLGWVLVDPAQKELTPQDVAASAGSSTA